MPIEAIIALVVTFLIISFCAYMAIDEWIEDRFKRFGIRSKDPLKHLKKQLKVYVSNKKYYKRKIRSEYRKIDKKYLDPIVELKHFFAYDIPNELKKDINKKIRKREEKRKESIKDLENSHYFENLKETELEEKRVKKMIKILEAKRRGHE